MGAMSEPDAHTLVLPSENEENSIFVAGSSSEYASEGLVRTLRAMKTDSGSRPPLRVVATNIFGPTWYGERGGCITPERCRNSHLFVRNSWRDIGDAVEDLSGRAASPHWRLSSAGLRVLGRTVTLGEAPLLNALNAFETMMSSAIFTAFDSSDPVSGLSAAVLNRERELARVFHGGDLGLLIATRLDRIVFLFCHTLAGIVAWKREAAAAAALAGGATARPPPSGLEADILERAERFVSPGCESVARVRGKEYAVPGIKATAVGATRASGSDLPAFEGAFYDTVLGNRVMEKLTPLVSAEYSRLLDRAEEDATAAAGDPEPAAVAETRARRRAAVSEADRRILDAVPRGVVVGPFEKANGEWDARGLEDLRREVGRETKDDPSLAVEAAVARVIAKRQLLYSNFAVTKARPLTMFYCLWNYMFLAAGGAAVRRPSGARSGRACRRLLADAVLLDFHALLRCPACSTGILRKVENSFDAVNSLRYGTEAGAARVMAHAFGEYEQGPTSLQDSFKRLLRTRWPGPPPHTADAGDRRLAQEDRETELAFENEEGANYSGAQMRSEQQQRSVGYALLGIYALLASSLYDDDDDDDDEETAVESPDPSDLLCVAGVWALRNAVRMGKRALPGHPLPLINFLDENEDWLDRITRHPALSAPADDVVNDAFAKFEDFAIGPFGSSVSAPLRGTGGPEVLERRRNSSHPFSPRGDLVWSMERIDAMGPDDLAALESFPMTEYG